MCVDKLWDKYYSLTPYHYSGNNPVSLLDGNGQMPAIPIVVGGGYIGGAVAIGIIGWAYTEATNPGSTEGLIDAVTTSFNKGVEDVKEVINNLTGDVKSEEVKETGNTNPYTGPVDKPVTVVDPAGNAIPVGKGEQIKTSPNGKWVDVKQGKESTGKQIHPGHPPSAKHPDDSRAWNPHTHVPGVTNSDGTPWLPIRNVSPPK